MCTLNVSTCPLLWQLSMPYTVAGLQVFLPLDLFFSLHLLEIEPWEPIRVFPGKVITAAYVPVVNYHNLFPGAQLFEEENNLKCLNLTSWKSKLNHFSCRLGQPFCQSALAQMNFLPLSLKRVVVDEFKSRIFSPHPDVDMFLPQLMEFGRNLNRCVLKPMRLVQHFHVVLDS